MDAPTGPWTEPAEGLHVRQSRAYWMNSAVLARDGHALVVDPGVLPSEMTDIAEHVARLAPQFANVTVAFTHPHWDHVLGRDWFPLATTLAHVGFADELARDATTIEKEARKWIEGAGEAWPRAFEPFAPSLVARGTARVECGPFEVVTHELPGHSASQLAYYLPSEGVLFAGDMLSDIEIPWLDGPPWVYRRSLTALHWIFEQENVRVLVPGHGEVALGRLEGYRRVLRDMDYLLLLEQRVGDAFAQGLTLPETQDELAGMEYLGKGADYDMLDVHRGNVKFTYDGLADAVASGDAQP